MGATLERVTRVFREVFQDPRIVVGPTTTAADIAGWDSLMHVTLLLHVEREFGIRFNTTQVATLKNVGQLIELIEAKQPA